MITRLSELARDAYSTSCEFREAARPCTHAVTIVPMTAGAACGRYVCADRWISAPVDQATAGATNVERSCSRGPDESVLYLYLRRLRRCGTGRDGAFRTTTRFPYSITHAARIQRYRSPLWYTITWQGRG